MRSATSERSLFEGALPPLLDLDAIMILDKCVVFYGASRCRPHRERLTEAILGQLRAHVGDVLIPTEKDLENGQAAEFLEKVFTLQEGLIRAVRAGAKHNARTVLVLEENGCELLRRLPDFKRLVLHGRQMELTVMIAFHEETGMPPLMRHNINTIFLDRFTADGFFARATPERRSRA